MNILTIVLHHTATEAKGNGSVVWEAIKRNVHPKRPATYICDYHFGIGPTGIVFPGQPIDQPSWHCGVDSINDPLWPSLVLVTLKNTRCRYSKKPL